jgi:hypothetical protein
VETQTNDTTKTRPAFGQRVRIKAKAVRMCAYGERLPEAKRGMSDWPYYDGHRNTRWKAWARWEFNTPREGLYIGYRTLQDGETWWEGEEIGMVFKPHRDLDAWLVVLNERQNPVLVFPEDVELVE